MTDAIRKMHPKVNETTELHPLFCQWIITDELADLEEIRKINAILHMHPIFQDMYNIFQGIIVGTFPIGLDIEGSDIDILLDISSKRQKFDQLISNLSTLFEINIKHKEYSGLLTFLIRFTVESFKFELFAQARTCKKQTAYLHMMVERAVLLTEGEAFKEKVLNLKKSGLNTEASFAKLLDLEGDPFIALLDYGKNQSIIQ